MRVCVCVCRTEKGGRTLYTQSDYTIWLFEGKVKISSNIPKTAKKFNCRNMKTTILNILFNVYDSMNAENKL